MNKTVFWTYAYNARKTLGRSIESVLNQTHGDFLYYILDNGSDKDDTAGIIDRYAKMDRRIVPLSRKINTHFERVYVNNEYAKRIIEETQCAYFAWLDADDEYRPHFLGDMLSFIKTNALDMAMCGIEYVDSDGHVNDACPQQAAVWEHAEFPDNLPKFYKYTTHYWGSLWSSKLVNSMHFQTSELASGANFWDSVTSLKAIQNASRIGLYNQCLHRNYVSGVPGQVSARYSTRWLWWLNELQRSIEDFAGQHGAISEENRKFIQLRCLIWLKYIFPRLKASEVSDEVKLRDMLEFFIDPRVESLMLCDWKEMGIQTSKNEFLDEQVAWCKETVNCSLRTQLAQLLAYYQNKLFPEVFQ